MRDSRHFEGKSRFGISGGKEGAVDGVDPKQNIGVENKGNIGG